MKNILLILTDQWRYDTLFQEGHPCQTPRLNAFAREAGTVAYRNAYTCYPLCTPARGALLTGEWPFRSGFTDNEDSPFWPHGYRMPRRMTTYPERLRDAGWRVAYSGKCHIGKGELERRGIETLFGDGLLQPGEPLPDDPEPLAGATGPYHHPYYASYEKGENYRDATAIRRGLKWLEGQKGGDKPFCLVIAPKGPHFPLEIPAEYRDRYPLPPDFKPDNFCAPNSEEKKPWNYYRHYFPAQKTEDLTAVDWREMTRNYWGYCTWLDERIGGIFDRLKEWNLFDETVIAFTPDHGEMLGAHGKFDKGPDFYEETVHIPLMMRNPDKSEAEDSRQFVNFIDLFPSLISAAGGGELLSREERERDFAATDHQETYMSYDLYHGRRFPARGIVNRDWKYTWRPNDLCELYDRKNDPGERNNLSGSEETARAEKELKQKIFDFMERNNDPLRLDNQRPEPGEYLNGAPPEWELPWMEGAYPTREPGRSL